MTKAYWRAFSGGEVTGELFGRVDLDKYSVGLANCENFQVLPHGPAANRPGFEFIFAAIKDSDTFPTARVIPFAFNATDTAVLVFTHAKIRFVVDGGLVLETPKSLVSMTSANPAVFTVTAHGFTNGQEVYVDSVSSTFFIYRRVLTVQNVTTNTFTLQDQLGNAIDSTGIPSPAFSVTFSRVYEIVTPYQWQDIMDIHYTQSADVLTLVHPTYEPRELRRLGAANWQLQTITFAPSISAPGAPTLTPGGPGGGTPVALVYVATAVASETFEESVASASATVNRDLTVPGNYVDITPPAVAGAIQYNIYKQKGGIFGYIGTTNGAAFRDDNYDPDVTQTPPVSFTPFVGVGNYPSAVTYFEQRRCFAATNNQPQHHWFTRSATESNLSQSIPVRDDDAIIFRIAAAQQNRVRHLVPLTDLLSLTVGAEWRITPASGDFLTPAVVPRPQSYVGCNNVQPVVTSASCIYVQSQGAHLRELAYGGESTNYGYKSLDASVLAPHLVDNYEIVDMAYSRAPVQMVYAVRNDGVLLAFTYVPEQNVRAWQHHVTDGQFESVCCVAEDGVDVLYAVVAREVQGATYKYVERLHSREFVDIAECFFVDSGLTYNGGPTLGVSNLWHLEGKTVTILADGAVQPEQVVTNGRVTIQEEASIIHVGLPYVATLDTMPLIQEVQGYGQGTTKNNSKAYVRVYRSSGTFVGPLDGRMIEIKQRTNEPYGSPPDLVTMVQDVNIAPSWNKEAQLRVQQMAPLPLTILSVAIDSTP